MTDCALIIFAKLPRPGEVKTRLGKSIGMKESARIYDQFARHAFTLADTVKSKGVSDYVFFTPGPRAGEVATWVDRPFLFVEQEGENLGERMRNAFVRTFDDGAQRTVIIGTDVPELNASIIESAFHQLADHDVVLGPSTDGGYYLLGMKPPVKEVFDGIEWSSEKVFAQTVKCLQTSLLSYARLPEFADVDTEKDYRQYLARIKSPVLPHLKIALKPGIVAS